MTIKSSFRTADIFNKINVQKEEISPAPQEPKKEKERNMRNHQTFWKVNKPSLLLFSCYLCPVATPKPHHLSPNNRFHHQIQKTLAHKNKTVTILTNYNPQIRTKVSKQVWPFNKPITLSWWNFMAYFRNMNLFHAGQVNLETTPPHFSNIFFQLLELIVRFSIPLTSDPCMT